MDRRKLTQQIEEELEALNQKIKMDHECGFACSADSIKARYYLVQTWVTLNPYFHFEGGKRPDYLLGPHGTTIPHGHIGEVDGEQGKAD